MICGHSIGYAVYCVAMHALFGLAWFVVLWAPLWWTLTTRLQRGSGCHIGLPTRGRYLLVWLALAFCLGILSHVIADGFELGF